MSWAKLDDGFYDHPKVLATSNAAIGLYCKALTYCGASRQVAATESEGFRLFTEFAAGANLATIAREAGVTRSAVAALLAGKVSRAYRDWRIEQGREREHLSPTLRALVIERDGSVCQLCGGAVRANDIHIDHIQPVSRGGATIATNLQVAHAHCNLRKGARWEGHDA